MRAGSPADISRTTAAIVALVAASVALTLGFACALPLAAFAAIAGIAFDLGAAIAATLAVWLTNQIVGFACLHYPTDPTTLAWGAALGALGLAALAAARMTRARLGGLVGAVAAFLAAFAAFEGLLFALDVGLGLDPAVFLRPVVARMFAINAAAFGALLAAYLLTARAGAQAALKLRRAPEASFTLDLAPPFLTARLPNPARALG